MDINYDRIYFIGIRCHICRHLCIQRSLEFKKSEVYGEIVKEACEACAYLNNICMAKTNRGIVLISYYSYRSGLLDHDEKESDRIKLTRVQVEFARRFMESRIKLDSLTNAYQHIINKKSKDIVEKLGYLYHEAYVRLCGGDAFSAEDGSDLLNNPPDNWTEFAEKDIEEIRSLIKDLKYQANIETGFFNRLRGMAG